MPGNEAKANAMRERARTRLLQERKTMTEQQKMQLPEIQKRLSRKTRSTLPVRERARPPVPV